MSSEANWQPLGLLGVGEAAARTAGSGKVQPQLIAGAGRCRQLRAAACRRRAHAHVFKCCEPLTMRCWKAVCFCLRRSRGLALLQE